MKYFYTKFLISLKKSVIDVSPSPLHTESSPIDLEKARQKPIFEMSQHFSYFAALLFVKESWAVLEMEVAIQGHFGTWNLEVSSKNGPK